MSLLAALERIDPQRVALIPATGEALRYGALCDQARAIRAARAGADQPALLTLTAADPAQLIAQLIAGDGAAVRMLLLPASLPEPLRESLSARASAAEPATPGATEWLLATSGTTGTPKLVRHGLSSLTRSIRHDPARGAGQIWGLMYDPARFAGLQVVLQALLSGAALALPDPAAPLADQLGALRGAGCTHLSATPTLWRKILMTGPAPDLRQITLGGEAADQPVLSALATAFPQARITHVYASTEAGVGFSVQDGRAGFPTSYLNDPPAGIALKIEDGRLFLRNPLISGRYLGDDGAEFARDGWVETGDRVRITGDRVLFEGRDSGVINVGGDKVHPEAVEQVILTHPQVTAARVYARRNPFSGALVAADIVPAPDAPSDLRAALTEWLRARLAPYAVPAVIRLTDTIQTTAAGKTDRSAEP